MGSKRWSRDSDDEDDADTDDLDSLDDDLEKKHHKDHSHKPRHRHHHHRHRIKIPFLALNRHHHHHHKHKDSSRYDSDTDSDTENDDEDQGGDDTDFDNQRDDDVDDDDDDDGHSRHRKRKKSHTKEIVWGSILILIIIGLVITLIVFYAKKRPSANSRDAWVQIDGIGTVDETDPEVSDAIGGLTSKQAPQSAVTGAPRPTPTKALQTAPASLPSIIVNPPSAPNSNSTTKGSQSTEGQKLLDTLALKPANVTALLFPEAAMADPGEIDTFMRENWGNGVKSEFISFVASPISTTKEIVLSVNYPKGSYATSEIQGGIGGIRIPVFNDGINRALLSYEVAFSEGFDWVLGGKLPGIYGGDWHGTGCSGGKHSSECLSLRLMWRTEGEGEVYSYIPTYTEYCESATVLCNSEYGSSIGRGSFNFTSNKWNKVTEIAVLNTLDASGPHANGVLSLYLDDKLAFTRSDIVFRTNATLTLTSLFFSTFFGGSSESFASKGGKSYFKNFHFFEGTDVSSEEGAVVKAILK